MKAILLPPEAELADPRPHADRFVILFWRSMTVPPIHWECRNPEPRVAMAAHNALMDLIQFEECK